MISKISYKTKLQYLMLLSVAGGDYIAPKTFIQWKYMICDLSDYKWIEPNLVQETDGYIVTENLKSSS